MPLEQGCRVHEPGGPPPTTTARELIERSPFVVIATCAADGRLDPSPKGDPPGFVHVIDSTTLAIPEPTGLPRTPGLSCTSCAARTGRLRRSTGKPNPIRSTRERLVPHCSVSAPLPSATPAWNRSLLLTSYSRRWSIAVTPGRPSKARRSALTTVRPAAAAVAAMMRSWAPRGRPALRTATSRLACRKATVSS